MDGEILEPLPLQAPGQGPHKPSRGPRGPAVWLALLVLALGLGAVWLLSRLVGPVLPVAPTPTPPPLPTSTPDPALRAAAEAAMGELLEALSPLRAERPDLWGGEAWERVKEAQGRGDAAMAAGDFAGAAGAYREGLEAVGGLRASRFRAPERLMREAEEAYGRGEAEASVERLEVLLLMEPGNEEAKGLLPRARVSEETYGRLSEARKRVEEGAWAEAWVDVERARELDALFPGLEELRGRVREAIAAEEFEQWISAGLAALSAGDVDRAAEFLERARGFRPEHPAVVDLGIRVGALRVQREVLRLREEAEGLEGEERWREAHEVWLRMKALDPQAPWIERGLEESLRWRTMEERIRLAEAAMRSAEAGALAEELAGMEGVPPGLRRKGEVFVKEWRLLHSPVTVRLFSDGETSVVLQRVKRWSSPFAEVTVDLLPGRYVALGTRLGYRDARVEFEVKPGAGEMRVEIRCTEGIR